MQREEPGVDLKDLEKFINFQSKWNKIINALI